MSQLSMRLVESLHLICSVYCRLNSMECQSATDVCTVCILQQSCSAVHPVHWSQTSDLSMALLRAMCAWQECCVANCRCFDEWCGA